MRAEADAAVRNHARSHQGVFTRAFALECGHTKRTITYRLKNGIWDALYPSVYVVAGTAPSWGRDQMAACLWMKGVAAGRAAGHLFGLPGCAEPPVEVLTASKNVMPHSGVIVHRTRWLPRQQIVKVSGIPSTSIERTLLDLCGRMRERRAAIALDDALRRGLTTIAALDHCLFLTARRGRNGCGVLRRLVHERWDVERPPDSPLESVILSVIRRAGLPLPELQMEIREHGRFVARPDFVYPEARLVVQGHSKMWHWGKAAENHDLAQHNALSRLGYRILYVTWADATRNPEGFVKTLDTLLRAQAA